MPVLRSLRIRQAGCHAVRVKVSLFASQAGILSGLSGLAGRSKQSALSGLCGRSGGLAGLAGTGSQAPTRSCAIGRYI